VKKHGAAVKKHNRGVLTLVRVPAPFSVVWFLPVALAAQCRLPDVAPGAIARLSPAALLDSGHYQAALRALDPIAQARPADGRIAWMMSRAKAALGQLDDALKLAEAALASDDSNAAYHVQVAAVCGRLAQTSGLLKQLSFARRAKKELDAAAALDPANSDAQRGLMMFYYAAPGLIGGDKNKALDIGRQLALEIPSAGLYYEGQLAAEMKDAATAENFYLRSAMADPTSFETLAEVAKFYLESKPDQSKAETWACAAIHADPTRGDGWALLARTFAMCGCWTEAEQMARLSEAIDPDDLVPWYSIAAAAIQKGEQIDVARDWLQQYLSHPPEGGQPSWARAHWQLGLALAAQGRRAEAITELKTAIQQEPANESARSDLKRISAESAP
jgi:tetratricopeptide (TPR) repeat protein